MTHPRMAGLAALIFLAGCSSPDTTTPDESADGTIPGEVSPPVDDMAATTVDPQSFANRIAASDQFEIDSAKVAQEKVKSKALRDFAAKMITDHTASSAKLKTAATAQGLTLDPAPTAQQRTDLAALRAATNDFDSLYLEQQLRAHEAALAALRAFGESGTQGALRDFATSTATVVDGHLKMLREMDIPARNAAATGNPTSAPAVTPPAAPADTTPPR